MAEKEDRWRVAPFVPNPHSRPEERIASALEYIATQIGQINQKMDYFRQEIDIRAQFPQPEKKAPQELYLAAFCRWMFIKAITSPCFLIRAQQDPGAGSRFHVTKVSLSELLKRPQD